jgi:hypothetical protein
MKPTMEFGPELLENSALFKDPFFERFSLRHAPEPLKLDARISKNYFFPTFYTDVSCAIGIFHCDYERASAILPDPRLRPVRMTRGRSLVIFSCYEYRNVMNVPPYNEIAMLIPIMAGAGANPPVLPMILGKAFSHFGYHVFSMPVTSRENEIRGRKIWGLPKVTQEIDIRVDNGDAVTVAKDENGKPYFELRVPIEGGKRKSFDESGKLYSRLDDRLLRSQTNFRGDFNLIQYPGLLFKKRARPERPYLTLHDVPAAKTLRELDIEEHPFQLRYTRSMNCAFDLPDRTL